MDAIAWINGKVYKAADAKVSVFDRGFLFGDGVYETGRSFDRCILYMEEHLVRLRRSAGKLQIPVPWSDEELKKGLYEATRSFGQDNLYFRTIVSRGPVTTVSLDEMTTTQPTLVHLVQSLKLDKIAEQQRKGIHVLTSRVIRNSSAAQDPNIKTSNYLNSLLALQDVKARGGDDAILCDADGNVTEGTTFSVFGVTKNGSVITPSLDVGILDSITRRHVIQVAQKNGITIKEGKFQLADFLAGSEAFVASSVREIAPIHTWDDQKFTPGPVTQKLQELLRKDIAAYVSAHEKF